jgi:hypothetical protein
MWTPHSTILELLQKNPGGHGLHPSPEKKNPSVHSAIQSANTNEPSFDLEFGGHECFVPLQK